MKHPSGSQVAAVASGLGIELPTERSELIAAHARWLIETNETVNLTAIKNPEDVLRLHVQDSLTAMVELSAAPEGLALDLGTGGGFPGFPLSVAADRSFVLLDSIQKKSVVLGSFLEACGWTKAVAVSGRAESHAIEHVGQYSVVVVRAVAELPALVELASPLLAQGGRLIAMKGRLGEDERSRSVAVGSLTGMRELSVRGLRLPDEGEARAIAVFERFGDSNVSLPRRIGMAQKKPLA